MSVQSETRDTAFRIWKQELDVRCEEHLLAYPEDGAVPVLASIAASSDRKVRCFESLYAPGAWNVYVGDARVTTFTGTGAHQKALEMVEFIESQQKKI